MSIFPVLYWNYAIFYTLRYNWFLHACYFIIILQILIRGYKGMKNNLRSAKLIILRAYFIAILSYFWLRHIIKNLRSILYCMLSTYAPFYIVLMLILYSRLHYTSPCFLLLSQKLINIFLLRLIFSFLFLSYYTYQFIWIHNLEC